MPKMLHSQKPSDTSEPQHGLLLPASGFWVDRTPDKQATRKLKFFQERKKERLGFGPGGAVGIGCGAGVGVAITGGLGLWTEPWNALRLVFGIGVRCGIGIGYGFGHGVGIRWDRAAPKKDEQKRIVFEI